MQGTLETPSGKGAGDENFQVGSWLLPAVLRPHVAAFYAFVRAADDIGDNPALSPEDKIARLDVFADSLIGPEEAAAAIGLPLEVVDVGVDGLERALAELLHEA